MRHNQSQWLELATVMTIAMVATLPASESRAVEPAAASNTIDEARAAMEPYRETVPDTDVTFELVPIPGGRFMIGSPAGEAERKDDEGPQFEVEVEPFYMGRYEVTWAECDPFIERYMTLAWDRRDPQPAEDEWADAVTYPTPMYVFATVPTFNRMGGRDPRHPAVSLSQFDARQYTKWLSKRSGRFYRLPTEAEWEYACRAGTTTAYSFGDDPAALADHGWYFDNSEINGEGAYRKVGQKKPNPWGLYDMHGNAAEWCLDGYDPGWYAGFEGRRVPSDLACRIPVKRYPRVIRGGGFESDPADCRSAARLGSTRRMNLYEVQLPESPHWMTNGFWIGFRVVSPLREPSEAEKEKYWDCDDASFRKFVRERAFYRHEVFPEARETRR